MLPYPPHPLKVISISINGASSTLDKPLSVAELIEHIQLGNKRIALECNDEIVPRGQFAHHMLTDSDKLEVVVAVGGG